MYIFDPKHIQKAHYVLISVLIRGGLSPFLFTLSYTFLSACCIRAFSVPENFEAGGTIANMALFRHKN